MVNLTMDRKDMMKQVTIKCVWQCGLCSEDTDTFSSTTIPMGWYRLDGWRQMPMVVEQNGCPSPRPDKIICPKCAHILKRALDFTKTPYQMVEAQTAWDKPISPGMITLMG